MAETERRDSPPQFFFSESVPTKGNSCSEALKNSRRYTEDEREIESESADADVFSNAREAKTNNAKANIFSQISVAVIYRRAQRKFLLDVLR